MTDKLQSIAKMDVYSDMQVPFDVATWARQHKFNPLSVAIATGIREREQLSQRIVDMERERDRVETLLKQNCAMVQEEKLGVVHGV